MYTFYLYSHEYGLVTNWGVYFQGPKVQQKTKEQKMAAALAGAKAKKKVRFIMFLCVCRHFVLINVRLSLLEMEQRQA